MKYRIFLMFLILFVSRAVKAEKVTVLNWWDYLDERIVNKLAKHGFNLEIQEYRSNEVAMSKIASSSKELDIAVLSNINLIVAAQANIINTSALKSLSKKRLNSYDSQIVNVDICLPFMWSSTVFSYDERVVKKAPKSINDLYKLKQQKIKIGIIDDQYEIASRMLFEQKDCASSHPLNDCIDELRYSQFLNKEDFVSSIEEIIKYGNFASYGWHGESAAHIQTFPWLNVEPADKKPVIGVDYVCILNSSKKDTKKLIKLIELLTDQESIGWNMQKTQYFSPYTDHDKYLHPKIKQLQKKIKSMHNSTPVMITVPNKDNLKKLNDWWKNVRYKE